MRVPSNASKRPKLQRSSCILASLDLRGFEIVTVCSPKVTGLWMQELVTIVFCKMPVWGVQGGAKFSPSDVASLEVR